MRFWLLLAIPLTWAPYPYDTKAPAEFLVILRCVVIVGQPCVPRELLEAQALPLETTFFTDRNVLPGATYCYWLKAGITTGLRSPGAFLRCASWDLDPSPGGYIPMFHWTATPP